VTVKHMVAVVLGGGTGTRFGASLPKQLLTLNGKTLVEHCVAAFAASPGIDEILLVMPPAYHDEAKRLVGSEVSAIITGGATRSDSVRNALAHIGARYDQAETGVLIHDAARPLVTKRIIADCVQALREHDAIGTAVPTSDTILAVANGVIAHVPPRETLYRAQTPQCFRLETITKAHALAAADPAFTPTDDCGVVLRYLPGTPVHIVPGSETNLKVTYPTDLAVAEALLRTHQQG
jgi:ribitol-5-phosphate 2-dehydrogenase (NADP+) / D-ribitol-5-phosphate cytidylyltransferase